jgi:hypothetical protein
MRTGRGLRSGMVREEGLGRFIFECKVKWALNEFLVLACRRECSHIVCTHRSRLQSVRVWLISKQVVTTIKHDEVKRT